MRTRVLGALAAALLFAWLPAVPGWADDAVAWTVAAGDDGTGRPNFVYEATPGRVVEDTWVVGNAGTEPITLRVYAADALTTATGQLDLQPTDAQPVGVGAWAEPSVESLTLAPGEESSIAFAVRVPADAAPGDHAGALVTSLLETADANLQIERRLATRIHVRVPGELTTSFAVDSLQASAPAAINPFAPVALEVGFHSTNDGTARAFGREVITVEGPLGLGRTTVARDFAETLPGSTLEPRLTLDGVWALGPTTVTVEVTPEGIDGARGGPVTTSATVWLVPWGWLGVVVVLLAVGVAVGVFRGRRKWEWVDAEPALSR